MGFLSSGGGGGGGGGNQMQPPAPPPPPPPPISVASSSVQAAGNAVRTAAAGMAGAGLNQNVVTGAQGAPAPATTKSKKTLGGLE